METKEGQDVHIRIQPSVSQGLRNKRNQTHQQFSLTFAPFMAVPNKLLLLKPVCSYEVWKH